MNREEIAEREIGRTDIRPRCAAILVFLFLLTLLVVPLIQMSDWVLSASDRGAVVQFPMIRAAELPLQAIQAAAREDGSLWERLNAANRKMLAEISDIEDDLSEGSVVGKGIRPFVQYPLLKLGWGTEKVLLGNGGWLFFKPAVDSLTGAPFLNEAVQARRIRKSASWEAAPVPDPFPAILGFADQLRKRDIELLLLPIPVKAGVLPEKLSRGVESSRPLHNASWPDFLSRLKAEGLRFEKIDDTLEGCKPAFLKTDTHWTWNAMDATARQLAGELRRLNVRASATFGERTEIISSRGDLFDMLPMLSRSLYPEESLEIRPVSGLDHGELDTPVLLMGDSFSNIYSAASLGWGAGAGLRERLAFHLSAPVKTIIQNNDGAFATRMELVRRLSRDPSYLEGIRCVVWEFTERELSFGDWKLIDFAKNIPSATGFIALKKNETRIIHGVIQDMGEIPDPAEAAYPDYLLALHLRDICSEGASESGEALVFVWAMRDYKLLPGARYHVGEELSFRIQPWSDVSSRLGSITRGEIFDPRILAEEPCWAEEISP